MWFTCFVHLLDQYSLKYQSYMYMKSNVRLIKDIAVIYCTSVLFFLAFFFLGRLPDGKKLSVKIPQHYTTFM